MTGVLMYYAVLAYPKRVELLKRRALIEAIAAMRFREFAKKGGSWNDIPVAFRRLKREKLLTKTNLGWKRIERRINAGVMGWCICLNGKYLRYSVPTPEGKVGLFLQGPQTVSEVIGTYIEQRHVSDRVHLDPQAAFANVAHRVWAESQPVLHLAMSNPVTLKIIEAQISKALITPKQIAEEFFASIHEPTWLRKALEDGERLKVDLIEQFKPDPDDHRNRGYKPALAITVLPTEDPAQATRI
jgi:hypothetical protein